MMIPTPGGTWTGLPQSRRSAGRITAELDAAWHLVLHLLVAVCVLSALPRAVHSRTPEKTSLYRIAGASDDLVRGLLQEGIVVSRRLPGACFVFGEERLTTLFERWGCAFTILEPNVAQHEHFLMDADEARLRRIEAPLRLLHVADGVAVVAVPRGQMQELQALGGDVTKLFRTPMRLPVQSKRQRPATHLASEPDAFIASLVAKVAAETLSTHVARLEAFGTRNATKPGGRAAAAWIAAQFESYGVDEIEIHNWSEEHAGNVIATIRGSDSPDEVYVLGGHYDSIVPESDFEPGADDNATGTATVLEVARILAPHSFAATLRLIAFGAEELGLLGSEAYAARAARSGEQILGVLNLDMLGYLAPLDTRDVDVLSDAASNWLLREVQAVGALYTPEFPVIKRTVIFGSSDHESFWRHGFPAIYFHEDNDDSPYIHTTDDISGLSYNDVELHTQCTRTALALMATLAGAREQVPVTFETLFVERTQRAVRLRWRLATGALDVVDAVTVQRASSKQGPFERRNLGPLTPNSNEFIDEIGADQQLYWYRLGLARVDGTFTFSSPLRATPEPLRTSLGATYQLHPGGPFQIFFRVGVPASSLHLGIYDVRGRVVRVLVSGARKPGEYLQTWDRRDHLGKIVARGSYFVHLRGPDARATGKIIVLQR